MSKIVIAATPIHPSEPRGAGRPANPRTGWSQLSAADAAPSPAPARKDYGRGLPPPGPSNYLVSTPNFLPFERDDDSKQGE